MVALDIDATLEHVQDPQSTVKVQVRNNKPLQSHLTFGLWLVVKLDDSVHTTGQQPLIWSFPPSSNTVFNFIWMGNCKFIDTMNVSSDMIEIYNNYVFRMTLKVCFKKCVYLSFSFLFI